jgi:hypothetical protein
MITKDSIHVTNKVHINHTNILIYTVLSDLSKYDQWWPGAKFTSLDNNRVEVSPSGPGSFTWDIESSVENEKIVIVYDGIFSGHGTWMIDKDGAMTYLSYTVSLKIEHGFYKFINKFVPIRKMHEKMMKKVFRNLDRYLNNYHVES